MSTIDQYKAEAFRLLNLNPLDVCERVAARLNGRGWKINQFNCKVEIFDAIRWYTKVHIKTDVTKKSLDEKWKELKALLAEMDMEASLVMSAIDNEYDTRTHRKYGYSDAMGGRRYLVGQWYDFHVEFKPAQSLAVSVLTEEEV